MCCENTECNFKNETSVKMPKARNMFIKCAVLNRNKHCGIVVCANNDLFLVLMTRSLL